MSRYSDILPIEFTTAPQSVAEENQVTIGRRSFFLEPTIPGSGTGSPVTGDWATDELYIDDDRSLFRCTAGGSPGDWIMISNGTSGAAVGADPTAQVGLTVVNGTESTYMRSDAAPPLDQAIAPTWTSTHTWESADDDLLTLGWFTDEAGVPQWGLQVLPVDDEEEPNVFSLRDGNGNPFFTVSNVADLSLLFPVLGVPKVPFRIATGEVIIGEATTPAFAPTYSNGFSGEGFVRWKFVGVGAIAGTPINALRHTSISGSGGPVTLTATPTIASGYQLDGLLVTFIGTSAANTVTFQDEASLSGSKLKLKAATRVLGLYSVLELVWLDSVGFWIEVRFSA